MAVYAAQLKQPRGYLPPAWFDDTELGLWIAEGAVKAAILDSSVQDDAVKAWAYYRAYDYKAQQKEDLPQSKSIDGQAAISYGADRAELWKAKAAQWLGAFNDVLAGTQSSAPTHLFATAPGRRGR